MTKSHFEKAAIRKRMAETGEPYSVAAREVAERDWWGNLNRLLAVDGKKAFESTDGLHMIASRPGMGMTTLILRIVDKLLSQGKKIHYVSLESTAEEVKNRLKIVREQEGHEYSESFYQNLTIDDNNGYGRDTFYDFESIKKKSDVLIIDFLELINLHDLNKSHLEVLKNYLSVLKNQSKAHGIPVIILSQLNRSSTDGFVSDSESAKLVFPNIDESIDTLLMVSRASEGQFFVLHGFRNGKALDGLVQHIPMVFVDYFKGKLPWIS